MYYVVEAMKGFHFDIRYSLHAKVVFFYYSSSISLFCFLLCVLAEGYQVYCLDFFVFLQKEMCFRMVAQYPTIGIIKRFIGEFIETKTRMLDPRQDLIFHNLVS